MFAFPEISFTSDTMLDNDNIGLRIDRRMCMSPYHFLYKSDSGYEICVMHANIMTEEKYFEACYLIVMPLCVSVRGPFERAYDIESRSGRLFQFFARSRLLVHDKLCICTALLPETNSLMLTRRVPYAYISASLTRSTPKLKLRLKRHTRPPATSEHFCPDA